MAPLANTDRAKSVHREVDVAALPGGPWDGRRYPYIPSVPLKVAGDLRFVAEREEVDPVTYEVLRWRLWGLNLEHADTIRRVSGTPVIVYMEDFATAVLTGRGDTVACSPTIQYFTGMADLCVKWTLEHRSANPGIADGDVFLQNDPFIGTTHQIDTCMYAPVFHDSAVIAWVFNSCHVGDIGGNAPGSFCIAANDIYDEPLPIPPVKVARGGELLADVTELFVRQSRSPELIALQLRSQFAGIQATKRRLEEMVARYGPAAVNGAMHRVIGDCAAIVGKRLAQIPDGTWRSVIHAAGIAPDPARVHRVVTTVTKRGDQVICTNAGTDPQMRIGNCSFGSWRSDLICSLANQLAYDQLGCPGGVVRHMQFAPVPGTLNCALHPAAVTTLIANNMTLASAGQATSQMLLSGPPEIAENSFTIGAGVGGFWMLTWTDAEGRAAGNLTGDSLLAASGASAGRDGTDQGGGWFMPQHTAGDVEEWEETMPIVYLYRKDAADTGGAGELRGGNGVSCAFIRTEVNDATIHVIGTDASLTATLGLAGGRPGATGTFEVVDARGLRGKLAAGGEAGLVHGAGAQSGGAGRLPGASITPLGEDQVLLASFAGSGGFGDPLRRDPARVARDVAAGQVSDDRAREDYGVVLIDGGGVDGAATARRRGELRRARLARGEPPPHPAFEVFELAGLIHSAGGALAVGRGRGSGEDDLHWACAECGQGLGPLAANHKLGCRCTALALPAGAGGVDYGMVDRTYHCPGCGTAISHEIARAGDPPFHNIELEAVSVLACGHPPREARS